MPFTLSHNIRLSISHLSLLFSLALITSLTIADEPVYQPEPAQVFAGSGETSNHYVLTAPHNLITAVASAGNRLIAVGANGAILMAENLATTAAAGNLTWQPIPSPSSVLFNDVIFVDERHGWIVGHEQNILHTTDGGQTWLLQHGSTSPNSALYQILAITPQHLIAVGADGLLLRTFDAGTTWQQQERLESDDVFFAADSMPADFGFHIDSITQLNDGSLLTTGEYGVLLHSTNNGATWRMVASPYIGSLFGALPYRNAGVLVYGLRGNVFVTDSVATLEDLDPEDFDYSDLTLITDSNKLAELGWRSLQLPQSEDISIYGASQLQDDRIVLLGDKGKAYLSNTIMTTLQPIELNYRAAISTLHEFNINGQVYWLLAGKAGLKLLPAIPQIVTSKANNVN